MKNSKKLVCFILALSMAIPFSLAGCKEEAEHYDMEKTPLVFASDKMEGVFSPFFSTAAADGNVVDMTQISMMGVDNRGEFPSYGDDEPVVVQDLEIKYSGAGDSAQTEYIFVLKNNLKFSDGVPLTLKDVLFNLYVYLDPVYDGSLTIYSTEIVGVKEYRTQSTNQSVQDDFDKTFRDMADARVSKLISAVEYIEEQHKLTTITIAQMKAYLAELEEEESDFEGVTDDYILLDSLFQKEVLADFEAATIPEGVPLTNQVQAFLYMYGLIRKDEDTGEMIWNGLQNLTEQQAKDAVYTSYMQTMFSMVALYTMSAAEINTRFTGEAKEEFFNNEDSVKYRKVSGINSYYHNIDPSATGITLREGAADEAFYPAAEYDAETGLTFTGTGYEVLSIKIDGVDPKAIWNFSFTVAPMHYYSNQEQCALFDYEEHFGIVQGSEVFLRTVLRAVHKLEVPMGAGPYKATNANHDDTNIKGNEFRSMGIVYYKANDNFMFGRPKVRYLRYQEINKERTIDALKTRQVHFASIDGRKEYVDEVTRNRSFLTYKDVTTMGYGYVGINAGKITNIYARRAIISVMNTEMVKNYYAGYADLIYRPISTISWADPQENVPYTAEDGQSYEYDETGSTAAALLDLANIKANSQGKRNFKVTFTIAGELTDHPAYAMFKEAADILNNKVGCNITVTTDPRALTKLATGGLTVWAAAWGQNLDPDMFQVYHMRSLATSTLNWGYREILKNTSSYEYGIISQLSALIDEARDTSALLGVGATAKEQIELERAYRKNIYAQALDKVMELAVELPTYNRKDLYIFNHKVIKSSSLTPLSQVDTFNPIIDKIWELELN